MKLVDYLDYWFNLVEINRIKLKTYWTYNYCIKKYINQILGSYEIENINSRVLNEFIITLSNAGLSRSSICTILSIVKNALRNYYEDELNRFSPNFNLFIPPDQKKTRNIYYYWTKGNWAIYTRKEEY